MKKTDLSIAFLLTLVLLVVAAACTAPAPVGNVSPEIERAVLATDWKRVAELCGAPEKLARLPILRAIQGHALLATNHNNDALNGILEDRNFYDRNRKAIEAAHRTAGGSSLEGPH